MTSAAAAIPLDASCRPRVALKAPTDDELKSYSGKKDYEPNEGRDGAAFITLAAVARDDGAPLLFRTPPVAPRYAHLYPYGNASNPIAGSEYAPKLLTKGRFRVTVDVDEEHATPEQKALVEYVGAVLDDLAAWFADDRVHLLVRGMRAKRAVGEGRRDAIRAAIRGFANDPRKKATEGGKRVAVATARSELLDGEGGDGEGDAARDEASPAAAPATRLEFEAPVFRAAVPYASVKSEEHQRILETNRARDRVDPKEIEAARANGLEYEPIPAETPDGRPIDLADLDARQPVSIVFGIDCMIKAGDFPIRGAEHTEEDRQAGRVPPMYKPILRIRKIIGSSTKGA